MNEIELALTLFNLRHHIEKTLKDLGVVRTHKFISDFGEWLACKLFNGTLASNPNEVAWDIEANGIKYQVKTHHKAETTPAQWSKIKTLEYPVIIFQLKKDYKVNNVYFITKDRLQDIFKPADNQQNQNEFILRWSECENIDERFINDYPFLF